MTLADIDRDGDLDAVFAVRDGASTLWVHQQRQLSIVPELRIGGPFRIEIRGVQRPLPATQSALLILGGRPLEPRISLPPFGDFGLDPLFASVLGPVPLDASGQWPLQSQLRNDPGLIGSTLFAQALVLHGASILDGRLTNVVLLEVVH